jgi:hypothetical protein
MATVLQISPFRIPDAPDSGGLIRIAEINGAYQRAGCDTLRCSIVTRTRDQRGDLDLVLPLIDRLRRSHLGEPSHLGPIRQRWATVRGDLLLNGLAKRITRRVDVIQLEHPWAIRLATGLRRTAWCADALIVYSAHNIEHELHRDIWTHAGCWNHAAQALHAQIIKAEAECARHADMVWAVSDHDARALCNMGAKHVQTVPNGCRQLPDRHHAPGLPDVPYLLFVGGDYPPNIEGFVTWLGDSLDWLPANTRIVLVGAAGQRLAGRAHYQGALNSGRLHNAGRVPQTLLDQLILHANGVLLPISQGGGTNLKTAEALCSQRPFVATRASMRGFDAWQSAPGVHLADSPDAFRQLALQLLQQAPQESAHRDTRGLYWTHILDSAVDKVIQQVSEHNGAKRPSRSAL